MLMGNRKYVSMWIKIAAYLLAICIVFNQSIVSMATENRAQEENAETTTEADMQETDASTYENSAEDDGASTEETDESKESPETAEREIPAQIEELETAQEDLQGITEQKSILALVYLCDKYEVKDAPSKDGAAVVSVVSGQSVQIESVDLDEEGNVWYKVSLYRQDKNYSGYIEKKYLATSDEDFLGWTDEYVEEEVIPAKKPRTMSIMTISNYPDINQFPASYQNALLALKQKYPNWIFVKMETGIDFNTAVSKELGDKSWISNSQPASWRNGATKQSGWSYASEGILRYYMDPRNFLTESAIFQFEQLTYNASYHTESAVQAIVANSFMSGDIPNEDMTYAKAFTNIGEELKISPFHLASRVLQEQGTKGTSQLISGTYSGYEGYYNYFNVGASGKDVELIVNGLKEAINRGWNTRYKSLYGGAAVIGQNYIVRGQDTLYLQKFNVTSNNTYNHQYMQNIQAPASEAPSIQKAYSNTGALDNSFVFKIPVYGNMPASACSKPDTTDTITLNKSTISSLAVDKTEKLIPYVNGSKPDNVNDMTFSSSNTNVATVDAQGVIKAISPGTATITCARSGAKSAACTVTVVKAEPVVDTPVLSPVVYKVGLKLADVSLPEGWNWVDGGTLLEAGTASYPAVYTPADTTRYLAVTKQIGLKVSQAIPSCTVPENLIAELGSALGDIVLPDGFVWESDPDTVLDQTGEQTYYLAYYPSDKNFFEMVHIPVIIKVIGDNTEPEESDDQGGTLPGGNVGDGNTGGSGTGGTGVGGPGSGVTGSSSTTSSSDSTTSSSGSTTSGSDSTTSSSTSNGGGTTGGGGAADSSGGTTGNGGTSNSSSTTTGSGTTNGSGTTPGGNSMTSSTPSSDGMTSGSTPSNDGMTSGSTPNIAGVSTGADTNNSSVNDAGTNTESNSSQNNGAATGNNNDITNVDTNNTSQTNDTNTDNTSQTNGTNTNNNSTTVGTNTNNNNAANGVNRNNRVTTNKGVVANNHNTLIAGEEHATEEVQEEPVYARPAVAMDMEDFSVLTEEILQMAKEQNIDLILTMNDRAKWYVNASTSEGGFSDIDMGVLFNGGIIPQELMEDAAGENEYLEFDLEHDGPFGFMAELEIALNPEDCGRYANLFYFDSEAETLDYICSAIIDENGYARFSMEHASSYVIIISDYPITGIVAEDGGTSGSAFPWTIFAVVLLIAFAAAGAVGYFCLSKRQNKEAEKAKEYEEEEDIEELVIEEVISKQEEKPVRKEESITQTDKLEEETGVETENAEDDWIEDDEWQEPEKAEERDPYAEDHAENDWIEDDEWDISNDWMDDAEWEKRQAVKKTVKKTAV